MATDPTRDTALRILSAERGVPLMIPGAFEPRLRTLKRQPNEPGHIAGPSFVDGGLDDRARAERQREGGGAPSQRRAPRHRS
jgi:hypothetical protein